MNQYDIILQKFCSEDDLRPKLMTPFRFPGTGKVYATDAHCLVVVPLGLCGQEYEERNKPNAPAVIPVLDRREPLSIPKLKELMSLIPMVTKNNTIDCSECDGDVQVEWEYKTWTKYHDCPECDGKGEFETAETYQERSNSDCIKIGNNFFAANVLDKLVFAADQLQVEEIYLKNKSVTFNSHLYEVGNIEVLIMPLSEERGAVYKL